MSLSASSLRRRQADHRDAPPPGDARTPAARSRGRHAPTWWTPSGAISRRCRRAGVDGFLFCNEADLPYQIGVGPEVVAGDGCGHRRGRGRVSRVRSASTSSGTRSPASPSRVRPAPRSCARCSPASSRATSASCSPDFGAIAAYREHIGAGSVAMFTNITPEFASSLGTRSIAARARSAAYPRCRRDPDQRPDHRDRDQPGRTARGQGRRFRTCRSSPTPASARRPSTRCSRSPTALFVGTSLKHDGVTWNAVDPERAGRFMTAVRRVREAVPA